MTSLYAQLEKQTDYYAIAPIVAHVSREFDGHMYRVDTVLNFHIAVNGRQGRADHSEDYIHTLYVDGRLYQDAYARDLGYPGCRVDAWMRQDPKFCGGWKREDWPLIKSRTSVASVRKFIAEMVFDNLETVMAFRKADAKKMADVHAAIEAIAST